MAPHSEFVQFVIEQMAPVGPARARRMFGGYGIYLDGLMFAIIADERLYLKTDAETQCDFERLDLSPFTYVARGRTVALKYYEAPPEVLEEPAAMLEWARKAQGAAMRAKRGGGQRSRRRRE